jgi:ribosomal protein S14
MLGEVERKLEKLGPDERRLREGLINGFAELVAAESSSERLSEIESALEALPRIGEAGVSREAALEAARMRNVARVLEDRARLKEECLRSGAVEKALGVGRERLRQMRERGQLVGIAQGERRPTLYPYWQFTDEGSLVYGLREIIAACREAGMGAERLHFFMTEPNGRLDGERPVDLLEDGEAEGEDETDSATDRIARVLLSSGLGSF